MRFKWCLSGTGLPTVVLSMVAGSVLVGGCGKLPKARGGIESSHQESLSEHLAVRFLPAGEDNEYPTQDSALQEKNQTESPDGVLRGPNELVFKEAIQLGDGKESPRFIVWDATMSGARVTQAYFEQETQSIHNERAGSSRQNRARYDEAGSRWFIALADVLGGDLSGVDPTNWVVLTLDLVTQQQDRQRIKIRFRVSPPLPKIKVISLGSRQSRLSSLSAYEAMVGVYAHGHVLASERYENPSNRPIKLWLSAEAPELWLKLQHHLMQLGLPPRGFYSESLTRLIVRPRIVGGPFFVTKEKWVSAVLGGGSSFVVEWVASPEPEQERCPTLNPPGELITRTRDGRTAPEVMGTIATVLEGQWSRVAKISDPYLSESKATSNVRGADARSLSKEEGEFSVRATAGTWVEVPTERNCSGLIW